MWKIARLTFTCSLVRVCPLPCARAFLWSGQHRNFPRGQAHGRTEQRHSPRNLCGLRHALHTRKLTGGQKDGPRLWAIAVDHLSLTTTSCYTPTSNTMSTPSSPVHRYPRCAMRTAGWPKGACHAPGQAGRRSRERACGRLGHRRAQEGKKHGEGQTSSEEAGEPCPTMRVVRQPRARRRRHGDLPGQGAGHVPCRVSVPVPRRHVAVGGAVGTTACAPTYDAGHQPCSGV